MMEIFLTETVPELPDKAPRWENFARVIPRHDEGIDKNEIKMNLKSLELFYFALLCYQQLKIKIR